MEFEFFLINNLVFSMFFISKVPIFFSSGKHFFFSISQSSLGSFFFPFYTQKV